MGNEKFAKQKLPFIIMTIIEHYYLLYRIFSFLFQKLLIFFLLFNFTSDYLEVQLKCQGSELLFLKLRTMNSEE